MATATQRKAIPGRSLEVVVHFPTGAAFSFEQPTHRSPWEQPSCPSSWEQPSRPSPWEQPSRSSHWEHPAEQSWSDTHESLAFPSPGNAATTLHKCPPLVVISKVSSKALPSSITNQDADEFLPADVIIGKYPKLCKPSKIPTLGV